MNQQSIAEILSANPWFESLREDHLSTIVSIASLCQWQAGETIFREGDRDQYLYMILSGRVALDISVPTRGRVTILTLSKNDVFGWSAVLPVVEIKTAGARAIIATQAIAFDAIALREACDRDHELGFLVYRRLTNIIAGRLTATRLQLLDMYAHGQEGGN
jgi:CRP/FNR family cyclic AMP-dependent transcriptional regulator